MNYKKFAYIYDLLMKDAPYSEWVDMTKSILKKYNMSPHQLVDLGCGTGSISVPLAASGFQMIGIDLSEEMLSIAYEKMQKNNVIFPLVHQDMRDFELPSPVDVVVSYCDSLNYLSGLEEIKKTFIQVNKNLNDHGLFIFDMHTPYKIKEVFNLHTFAWNDDEVSVIWTTEVDETELKVEHELSFFVRQDGNTYERFDEIHCQQAYTLEEMKKVILESGFEVLEIFYDFQLEDYSEEGERVFFVVRKKVEKND